MKTIEMNTIGKIMGIGILILLGICLIKSGVESGFISCP